MTLRSLTSSITFPLLSFVERASASVFNGGGLESGVQAAGEISGTSHLTLREAILSLLYQVLSYLALLGVFMIIIGGAYLIVSGGSDEIKEKVKKIVLYVVIGLIIVLLARVIVGFFTQGLFLG